MTAPRFDLYTLVHKGQRQRLFDLTAAAGRIGGADPEPRRALQAAVDAFIDTLLEHAEHEDRFIGPLLAEAAPATQAQLHADHASLHASLVAVQAQVARALANPAPAEDLAAYRVLADLTSTYLAHVAIEEAAMPALWARYDDATLAKVQGALVAAHKPQTVLFNLGCMLPAASSPERIGFLSGLKRNLPPPAFAGIRANVAALVAEREWAAIDAA